MGRKARITNLKFNIDSLDLLKNSYIQSSSGWLLVNTAQNHLRSLLSLEEKGKIDYVSIDSLDIDKVCSVCGHQIRESNYCDYCAMEVNQ